MNNWWLRPEHKTGAKKYRKGLVIFLCLILVFFGVMLANIIFADRGDVLEGVFLDKGSYIQTHRSGSQEYVTDLFFKLDSGEEIFMKKKAFEPSPLPGQRVKIYYRKGAILNNPIYDSFELIK